VTTFNEKLQAKWDEGKFVCVGLDSEYEKLRSSSRSSAAFGSINAFNQAIVDATADLACAYKPNIAFYSKYRLGGLQALEYTFDYIRRVAPDVPIILDAKRGDIGSTNEGYVEEAFNWFGATHPKWGDDPMDYGADAVTINPYLGMEAMKPFLDRADKGVIVLCRTSNPGAGEFQDLEINVTWETAEQIGTAVKRGKHPWLGYDKQRAKLYQLVARNVACSWNYNGNCAVVAGATYPEELAQIRRIVGDIPILIPGIGAQGGDLEATVKAGANSRRQGMIINSSRGIIFADDPRGETLKLHKAINAVLAAA